MRAPPPPPPPPGRAFPAAAPSPPPPPPPPPMTITSTTFAPLRLVQVPDAVNTSTTTSEATGVSGPAYELVIALRLESATPDCWVLNETVVTPAATLAEVIQA